MRVTNIDTLSALFDRLITERIKWYFFNKENNQEKTSHQTIVIEEIKTRIDKLFSECLESKEYLYLNEQRTFNENSIVEELEDLIINDINIGEADRARLEETTKENPSIDKMVINEKRLRKANEGRARNKNKIDQLLYKTFK